ncbi:MAG: hypothetical protein FH748_04085 [Balneolaceae bacterium]|nr:hypothetical protein [Balneolaceae bacterium]
MSLSLKKIDSALDSKITKKKKIPVFIAGIGAVGGTLLSQIHELNHPKYDLEIQGACNSSFTQWNPDFHELLNDHRIDEGDLTNWEKIPEKIIDKNPGNLIFIDATGSEVVARQYENLLSHGVHIATPSKRANSFEQSYFEKLSFLNNTDRAYYRYETAVGAGLPVISTINNLLDSGDEVTEIAGVVSGTMTYIFTQLQNGLPFSQIVREAREKGYSEPDPRDDLSGEDVARKFLILARTCGYTFERDQLRVDTLVPEKLIELSTQDFLNKLPEYDGHWKNRNTKALVNNKKLRYVGRFTPEGISVGIDQVNGDSPLGGLSGTDNLIQIYTKRYSESPITIQGPGAGKAVTAAGLLGDIIKIAEKI